MLLPGTEGDKFHELIRSLLCKCIQPKEGVFHIAIATKNVLNFFEAGSLLKLA